MSEYQREQEKARLRRERRERRAERRLARKMREQTMSELDKAALAGAQRQIQDTLDAEREEFLEREPYERVADEEFRGYRNGYGEARQVHLGCGSVKVEMPRVAGSSEPFRSGLLAPYQRTSPKVLETLPQLYLHGVSTGDFEAALECLLGVGAALSPSTIVRLKEKWYEEYVRWSNEPLASHYAYIWADGIYLKVGHNTEKLALLVIMGADCDGRKRILLMEPGLRESYEQWLEVLRRLRARGVDWIGLAIADGIPGFWRALGEAYPEVRRQRCWVHKMRNILDKMGKKDYGVAQADLRRIYKAATRAEAVNWIVYFADTWHRYPLAVKCLLESQDELLTYFDFPREHWQHLKTTNPLESVFSPVRSRLRRAKRILRHWSALGLVYQLLQVRQTRLNRINAAHLAAAIVGGTKYRDGKEIKSA